MLYGHRIPDVCIGCSGDASKWNSNSPSRTGSCSFPVEIPGRQRHMYELGEEITENEEKSRLYLLESNAALRSAVLVYSFRKIYYSPSSFITTSSVERKSPWGVLGRPTFTSLCLSGDFTSSNSASDTHCRFVPWKRCTDRTSPCDRNPERRKRIRPERFDVTCQDYRLLGSATLISIVYSKPIPTAEQLHRGNILRRNDGTMHRSVLVADWTKTG